MEYVYITMGVAAVTMGLLLPYFIKKLKAKRRGVKGEKKVARKLQKYARIRSFKVINDLYLPLYDKTTQVDHVLIGFFGILVVETKNLGGDIYGDPSQKNWLHAMGTKKHDLYNPMMQNQAHIDCIRHHLAKANIYNVHIDSLVVFADKSANLYLPNGLPVILITKLHKYLKKNKDYQKDRGYDVKKLYDTLMNARVTDKKLIAEHNKNVKEMAKN